MSDFVNGFWPLWIAGITLLGIFGCLLLLWFAGKVKVNTMEDGTTGHVYDEDLVEMNNPMPRWWMWMFIITSIFALIYLVLYPGLGVYNGKLGWTQLTQFKKETEEANKALEPVYAKYAAAKVEDLVKDSKAMGIAQRLFLNNCAACHGSDAQGSKGFPNLTDGDWLHGGNPEKIIETITNGRNGVMPPMAALVGGEDDVKNVAHYVLSLSDSSHDAARAELGKAKFAVCAACHGEDGKGKQEIGSANLTDNIWLHGAGEKAIITRMQKGITNHMPAQTSRYTPAQIHLLAAYVWGFSNNVVAK